MNEFSPMFSSGTSADVPENTTTVLTVEANDKDGTASIEYSVSGGADRDLFQIDSDNGQLTFRAAPDYENPGDMGTNNMYEVVVTASDGENDVTQAITVTVMDVNDNVPTITSSAAAINLDENISYTGLLLEASDADDGSSITFVIGGTDSDDFTIESANESAGTAELHFVDGSNNYEDPQDGNTDRTYNITITANDGTNNSDPQNITITIADVNDAPVLADQTFNIVAADSNTGDVITQLNGTDQDATDDDSSLTYELRSRKNWVEIFRNMDDTGFGLRIKADNPKDAGGKSFNDVVIRVMDDGGAFSEATFTVNFN
ncbi:MAG: cadherin repeat domain-containing protein [Ekhidna sp.]|nr:cadherin repeat domain-containing protein [Ekhidna sp.]